MKRRTLLAAAGTGLTAPVVGCLEDPARSGTDGGEDDDTEDGPPDSTDGRTYDACHLASVDYEWLPDDVREEVDAALRDGSYEAETIRFDDAVDPDRSYLVVDGTPYDPVVETKAGTELLELRETDVVRTPEPRRIAVSNDDDRERTVRIELTDGDDALVDETVTLEPGAECELEATDRFGAYELTARTSTGHEDRFRFRVGDSYFEGMVTVTDDGVAATQIVAEIVPCSWESEDGE